MLVIPAWQLKKDLRFIQIYLHLEYELRKVGSKLNSRPLVNPKYLMFSDLKCIVVLMMFMVVNFCSLTDSMQKWYVNKWHDFQ
jgi:hypothetical protein